MIIKVSSIKQVKNELCSINLENTKLIVATSYNSNIDNIKNEDKLILYFDDVTMINKNSINKDIARKINEFVSNVKFDKEKLYICCDSGISRSSAIAAAILRKYGQDEDIIWKNYCYQPNMLVYKVLCEEFNLKNSFVRLKYKESINKKALKRKIKESRKA